MQEPTSHKMEGEFSSQKLSSDLRGGTFPYSTHHTYTQSEQVSIFLKLLLEAKLIFRLRKKSEKEIMCSTLPYMFSQCSQEINTMDPVLQRSQLSQVSELPCQEHSCGGGAAEINLASEQC